MNTLMKYEICYWKFHSKQSRQYGYLNTNDILLYTGLGTTWNECVGYMSTRIHFENILEKSFILHDSQRDILW